MNGQNMLVLLCAALFVACTLEVFATPVRNLQNNEPAFEQIRSAVDEEVNVVKSLSLADTADLLSYIEGHRENLESEAKEVRASKPGKKKCKGKKPKPYKKPGPPRKFQPPQRDMFQNFNNPLINKDCIMGDIILAPEDCLRFFYKN